MQIERGPGRGPSQAPPRPGWAATRPKIDDFRSYPLPPKHKSKNSFDCIGVSEEKRSPADRRPPARPPTRASLGTLAKDSAG